jgi:hypothetical protein
VDYDAPLTVGNGGFAFSVDVTGLQTIPARSQSRHRPHPRLRLVLTRVSRLEADEPAPDSAPRERSGVFREPEPARIGGDGSPCLRRSCRGWPARARAGGPLWPTTAH